MNRCIASLAVVHGILFGASVLAAEPESVDLPEPQPGNDEQQPPDYLADHPEQPPEPEPQALQSLPAEPCSDGSFQYQYIQPEISGLSPGNPAIVALGIGINRIKAGNAEGLYLSGMAPVSGTPLGIYGRAEIIRDKYKTGYFWSWNTAVGVGLYRFRHFTPFVSVGKCFSNYSTCYFNTRHPTANDDDIDAIYFGAGTYIKSPFRIGVFELAFDWSFYKQYRGRALYLGYGLTF